MPTGLERFVVLFFMELSPRRIEIGGIASRANGLWMAQIARNLTDGVDGFFKGKRYLIHDRIMYFLNTTGHRICNLLALQIRAGSSPAFGTKLLIIKCVIDTSRCALKFLRLFFPS